MPGLHRIGAIAILGGFLAGPILATASDAADAARPVLKAPSPPVEASLYNWTGFYVGAHGGYAWAQQHWFNPAGVDFGDQTGKGGIWGGQIGFNWQTGRWVLGVEAQASASKLRQGHNLIDPGQDHLIDPNPDFLIDPDPDLFIGRAGFVRQIRIGTTVEHLGSVAVRVGYAWDRLLAYAKGGGAWAHDVYRVFNADLPGEPLLASASHTRWGWMAGVGLEYGLAPNWSAKIEYNYYGLGTERITVVSIPGVTPPTRAFDVEQTISLVKIGINYRFALAGLAARP